MSKGSRNRTADHQAFREGHDRIFGSPALDQAEKEAEAELRRKFAGQFDVLLDPEIPKDEMAIVDLANERIARIIGLEE